MKYNSMKTAPKGRMPAKSIEGMVLMYHSCEGIGRGILFVLTEYSYG